MATQHQIFLDRRSLIVDLKSIFIGFVLVLVFALPVHADPFADAVTEVVYGDYGGFGQDELPDIVLGPPRGGGTSAGSTHVLSLGDNGSITLEFADNIALNGAGPDIILFENAFFVGGDPENTFCEVAFVEVSQDGVTFYRFPNDYNPEGEPVNHPNNWTGFAGVMPVLSHPDNGIDPTDPETAGGDAFDLEDIGLDWARYVRIIDTGEPPNAAEDDDGDPIYDQGFGGGNTAGFDLDAIAAVYSDELVTPTPIVTPTETPEPSASATPEPSSTPTPDGFVCDLILSQRSFSPGDRFKLDLTIRSPESNTVSHRVFIILNIDTTYYFWPGWLDQIDSLVMDIQPGVNQLGVLEFNWPDTPGHADGLLLWSALLDLSGNLLSNIEREEFSY